MLKVIKRDANEIEIGWDGQMLDGWLWYYIGMERKRKKMKKFYFIHVP